MKGLFYKILIRLTKILGPWIFILLSQTIAAGYFIFFPNRIAAGFRFYRALFPQRRWMYYLWCTWKQYQSFTFVFLDRLPAQDLDTISYTTEGLEHLESAIGKTGGILLMSHLGNWEMAAHILKRRYVDLRLLLYMGERNQEEIERIQKEDLLDDGVKIIAVNKNESSPFDIIEGIHFLRSGGFVSLAGDVIWQKNQRAISVEFLGHEAYLPEAPYTFALLSGAPLFIFFAFRTGKEQYHFYLSRPYFLKAASRAHRSQVIQRSAQHYADLLEQTVREHPFEWYHFEPFIGSELKG